MQSHKRAPQRRFPLREAAFLAALLGAAIAVSWYSGRTMVLNEIVAPVLGAVNTVTGAVNGITERITRYHTLEKEHAQLKKRVAELETTLATRDEQALENARLHNLLGLNMPPSVAPLVARVIGRNPDNWHHRLMLDVGQDRDIKPDGAVVTDSGFVGRVVSVSAHTAVVMLATDPAGSVSVLNTRTRSVGVMQGQGDSWPALRYMEQPEKWKIGDRLITSGLGGTIPKGLTVGKVVRLKNEKGEQGASVQALLFPELRVATSVDLSQLENVIVLPPGLKQMPTPPPPTPRMGEVTREPKDGRERSASVAGASPLPAAGPHPQMGGHE